MKKVIIYSDGGCSGNPGPGGWAAVLTYEVHRREVSGGALATTNNRMELQAAIEGLSMLKEPCAVEFFTDSKYVRNGVTGWISSWKLNGWKTKAKQPVKNEDLWRALDVLNQKHQVEWRWLKGHAGHAGNERCDQLAQNEIARIRQATGRKELKQALAELRAGASVETMQEELFGR